MGVRYRETSPAKNNVPSGMRVRTQIRRANFESKPERGPLVGPLFMPGPESAHQLCICHICPQERSSKDNGHTKTKRGLGCSDRQRQLLTAPGRIGGQVCQVQLLEVEPV